MSSFSVRSFIYIVKRVSFVSGVSIGMLVFAFSFIALETKAAINEQITYQAKLLDSTGTPVADGTYSVKISLYDDPTAGSRLWTATGTLLTPTALSVSVSNGLFTLNLGDTSASGGWQNVLSSVDWSSGNIYLGITVGGDAEMTPRRRLTAAPQAFNSEQLQGMYASSSVTSAGGSLFTIHQKTNDSAIAERTALSVQSKGTSNTYDFIIKALNDLGTTVFSVNRQGVVSSTALFTINTTTTNLTVTTGLTFPTNSITDAMAVDALTISGGTINSTPIGGTTPSTGVFTNVTTTNATTTNLGVTGNLLVGGLAPCLSDGTNCLPGGGGTDLNWTYNGASDFFYNATATTDVALGSTATSTAPFFFKIDGASASSNRMIVGGTQNADLVVGSTTGTASDGSIFQLDGGSIHAASNIFSRNMVGAVNGVISGNSGSFASFSYQQLYRYGEDRYKITFASSSGFFTPDNDGLTTLGSDDATHGTNRFNGIFMNTTSVNATATNIFVTNGVTTNATSTNFYATKIEVGATGVSSTGPVSVWGTSATSVFMGNVAVGTSTRDLPMHSLFTMDGNDLLVGGNIGAASSVYTNGAFVAGTGSTWFGNGFVKKTDGNLDIIASGNSLLEALGGNTMVRASGDLYLQGTAGTVYVVSGNGVMRPTGDLGVQLGESSARFNAYLGNTTTTNTTTTNLYVGGTFSLAGAFSPASISATNSTTTNLDVTGDLRSVNVSSTYTTTSRLVVADTISNQFTTASTFVTSTFLSLTGASTIALQNRYMYVGTSGPAVKIYHISDRSTVSLAGTVSLSNTPVSLVIQGNYLYAVGSTSFYVIDISTPSAASLVSETVLSCSPYKLLPYGRYFYGICDSLFEVVDVVNPRVPTLVNSITNSSVPYGAGTIDATILGKMIYYSSPGSSAIFKMNISNPVTGDTYQSFIGGLGNAINAVHGIGGALYYAFGDGDDPANGNKVRVADTIASEVTSTLALSHQVMDSGTKIASFGRYVFVLGTTGTVSILEANNPYSPSLLSRLNFGAALTDIAFDGRYVYIVGTNTVYKVVMPGMDSAVIDTQGLTTGGLRVRNDVDIDGRMNINQSLSVGFGGIYSEGQLGVFASSSESAGRFINNAPTSTGKTWGAYINRLLVGPTASATGTADYSSVITYDASTSGLCLINAASGALKCPNTHNVSIYADEAINANAFDLAERYNASGIVVPADLLVLDPTTNATVKQSTGIAYDPNIIGVASTKPGFLLGTGGNTSVALTGRVPLKFSPVNGAVHVGDALTSSPFAGFAMKATKPGRIVGYALEDASTTSTAEVFVNVGYNAANVLQTNGTLAMVTDDLTIMPRETATALHPTQSSYGLTFRGSAWNGSEAIASEFQLSNDVQSTTESAFTIKDGLSNALFSLSNTGSLALANDLTIGGRLYLSARGTPQSSTYMFVDTSASPTSTYIATNADGWQANDSYDFAERFYSPDALEPGDLVVVSERGQTHIQRSLNEEEMLVGIVSTRPAFVAGAPKPDTFPVALAGRVPTKVSALNGSIKPGDPLAPSTIPGIAMKATKAGPIVGLAMETYDMSGVGKIEVNVNPTWWGGEEKPAPVVATPTNTEPTTIRGFATIASGSKRVHVAFSSLLTIPNIQAVPYGETGGAWWIEKVTDTGFDIIMSAELPRDILWSWTATAVSNGEYLYHSDGTYSKVDPTTGVVVPGTATTTTVEQVQEPVAPPSAPEPDPEPIPIATTTTTEPVIETPSSTEAIPTEPAPIVETPVVPIAEPSTETTSTVTEATSTSP